METIRFTERRKTTRWPAILVMSFLIIGGCFVAYAIKNEDNPKMLGFSSATVTTESNGLENVGDLIHDYLIEYHTYCNEDIDTIHKMFSDLDIEDIVDEFSAMYEQFQKLSENIKIVPSLVKIGDVLSETKARPEKKVKFVSLDDADNIITDFINKLK